jgi:hypothetical protein
MTAFSSTNIRQIGADDTSPDVVRYPNLKRYEWDGTSPNAASGTLAFPGLTTLVGVLVSGEAAQPTAVSVSTNVATITVTASTVCHGEAWGT